MVFIKKNKSFLVHTQQFSARVFVLFVKNRRLRVANTPPWVLPLCVLQWERQGDAGGGRWGRAWEGQFVRWFDLDSFTGSISFCSRVLADLH